MRASSDGTAMPVTVVVMIMSRSAGLQARFVERGGQRLAAQVDRVLDEDVVGFAEVAERRVLLDRQDQMAAVDLRIRVQAADDVARIRRSRDLDEGFGDLVLGVAVRGQRTLHAGDDAALY